MLALKPLPFPHISKPRIIQQRPRRKRMTIAAGFVFDDGLLFCVDTKIATAIKTNESKLLFFIHGDGQCATAFAMSSDDLNFPKSAIESCRDAVDKINLAGATIESVRKAIQSALAKFYREHVFPHPDRSAGAIYLQLLVGIWLRGKTRMFGSHETLLTPIDEYECLGSGAYLAKYFIKQYLRDRRGQLTLEDAGLIASFAVERAIDYDEYCGGEAEMLIVKNTGETEQICSSVLYPGGKFIETMQAHTWNLLHDLAHVKDNMDSETGFLLEQYFEKVRKLNADCKLTFDSLHGLRKRLEGS